MEDKIISILIEIRPEFDFSKSVNFVEDGFLDSFDIVQMVVLLENEFNVSIDGLDIVPENFSSVKGVVDLLIKNGLEQ